MAGTTARKTFVVGAVPVRVRPTPSLEFPERRWLQPGERIECEPGSRTESAGHVWWQHADQVMCGGSTPTAGAWSAPWMAKPRT